MLKKLLLHKNLGGANIFFEGMINCLYYYKEQNKYIKIRKPKFFFF
jgi:hypothetical protein